MSATSPFGALAGLKVIDLSRVLGGPYCTQILGDHGAQIVKIEPPQGDEVRDWGPPFHDEDASYFIGVNRNKRSMGLDLSREEGRATLLRLLDGADILLENYKPGTMERWGLGYHEVLAERFPRLIHARISGFGADGPLGGYPGYDAIVQAMAGMFSVNGEPDSGPTRLGIAMVDMGTGLYTAIALLMAVVERTRSGKGQYVDMTLYDCAISLMHPHVANYYLSGKTPGLTGSSHPNISPYDKFKTRTTEIFLGAGNNRAFSRLCEELGRPELAADPRFRDNRDRVVNRIELTRELEVAMADVDGHELCKRLLAAGLPAGPVMNTAEVMSDPHTLHREMAVEKDWYRGTGIPIKLSRTPGEVRRTPPPFGAHGRELLAEHGFSTAEIDALIEAGAVVEKRRR
ncbi:MAG: CoA transferase [Ectothiorhodospiraceae bacterium]|nr:CoA transferase [Chromatiales bacterium]MCP5154426.1 CoA transferase [Ectothiorhodospiraceae bacterium]